MTFTKSTKKKKKTNDRGSSWADFHNQWERDFCIQSPQQLSWKSPKKHMQGNKLEYDSWNQEITKRCIYVHSEQKPFYLPYLGWYLSNKKNTNKIQ